jgi:hypothetical protein
MISLKIRFALFVLIASVSIAHAQKNNVYVDKQGVMRWTKNKQEVYGFGVNYTVPFAHAYRTAGKLKVNLQQAIDDDVYHFARLGFDAFRVHVWDTEISDSTGTLLNNDHLKMFDYLLLKLKERGIKIFITPIAFWGNGWPEPDEWTPGFSHKYGKEACLANEDAIRAQEKYLFQFLSHVNPYTKIAYKDDPDIVGFEVSNEPHHREAPEKVTALINRLVASMRKTGCEKPILYNISHAVHLSDAYFKSNINGGTFQWYPTGLGAQHELRGNFLPNVDQYIIPFAKDASFRSQAKVVYEFDAADIGRSYIYPAMARSFREAGIQWATHFAYDPTFMAYANTEYGTHYMNLAYAPQKAISLKIASEVFHRVPRYKSYGRYPDNTSFDGFRVSYPEDLAEMATDAKFFYTNTTQTVPAKPDRLEEICGYGNSPVVSYDGYGAYFLDRIEPGVWRLEVMPDAIWTEDPFGKNSLQKSVAVINHRSWTMSLRLPDIGQQFTISDLKANKKVAQTAGAFTIAPGVYLVVKNGVNTSVHAETSWKNIRVGEFVAPASTVQQQYVLHTPAFELAAGQPAKIQASIITQQPATRVMLYAETPWGRYKAIPMQRIKGYDYDATIPEDMVRAGYLKYYISVTDGTRTQTFPVKEYSTPDQWDFVGGKPYQVPVKESRNCLYLFDAAVDTEGLSSETSKSFAVIPGEESQAAALQIELDKLSVTDSENLRGIPPAHYSMRYNFAHKLVKGNMSSFTKLVFRGESLAADVPLQISLVDKIGNAFGASVIVDSKKGQYVVNLSDLKPVQLVSLPRPFPSFLPYYVTPKGTRALDMLSIESLQLSVGDGVQDGPFKFRVQQIWLE